MAPAAPGRTIALYLDKRKLLLGLRFSRLLVPAPLLVVNDRGILFHPPGFLFFTWRMEITWPEIAAMYVHEMIFPPHAPPPQLLRLLKISPTSTHRHLAIIPKDPEAFVQRQRVMRRRNFPLLVVIAWSRAPFMILEPLIAPVSVDDLLAQMRTRFQAEIEANGIEIREPQKTEYPERPQRPVRRPRRSIEDLSLDREAFRQWLEQQEGPLVGMGRTNILGGVGGTNETGLESHDETPLARYLAGVLGYQVVIGAPLVFPLRAEDQPMRRLPPWARAFEQRVQPTPEKTVTKEEALAALDQV